MTLPLQIRRWHRFATSKQLSQAVCAKILQSAERAIAARGGFSIVLAGGKTPEAVYRLLARTGADWKNWQVYFGDERCLPRDDPERNSKMAFDAWLGQAPIPENLIHVIKAEHGAAIAAQTYSEMLREVECFDLVLLGLGEDGHTASLFPEHESGKAADSPAALAVFDAPKPPACRVSLSADRLSRSREVLFMVSGKAKRQALADWNSGKPIPASFIAPQQGVDIYTDLK